MTQDRPVGNELVRVGVLGTAHTGHAWAYTRALREVTGVEVVGVHDADPEHTRWIVQDFGVRRIEDADELLDAVDAVVVCSANGDHRRDVQRAAAAGRHVLCEKPLATTVEDARTIVETTRAAGVQLHVAFPARFQTMVARARVAVREGQIGDLVGLGGANRGRPPLPPSYPAWITDPVAAGGGALIDHSVHVVDALRHVSGLEVASVSAEAGALLWGLAVDDVAVLTLRWDNGAVGAVDPSWSIPADHPFDYDFWLRLVGTEGSLDLTDGAEALRLTSTVEGGPRGMRHVSFADDADVAMLDAFVASVRGGEHLAPSATGDDGLRAVEVALAAYRSAELGEVVELR